MQEGVMNLFMHVIIHSFVQWTWSDVVWEQHWRQGQVRKAALTLNWEAKKWLLLEGKLKNILEDEQKQHGRTQRN